MPNFSKKLLQIFIPVLLLALSNAGGQTIITIAGGNGDGHPAATYARISPKGVAIDGAGNIYIADGGQSIRKVTASTGMINTYVAAGAYSLTNDATGNLYFVGNNSTIVKLTPSGIFTTLAGNPDLGAGFSGDGGAATAAQLNGPSGIAIDATGNIYIADYYNYRIRKLNTSGIITTIGHME